MKKGRIAVWDMIDDRYAAALLVNGKLDDLIIDPKDDQPIIGSIYRAKAGRPAKGQGATMIDLGHGQTGFLKGAKGIKPGDMITVQITGYGETGKAAPASTKLNFKGRYAIITPDARGHNIARSIRDDDLRDELALIAHESMLDAPENMGLILRSSCADAQGDAIGEEVHELLHTAMAVCSDTSTNPDLLLAANAHGLSVETWSSPVPDTLEAGQDMFETLGIWDHIEALKSPKTALPSGGSFFVEPTRALVAVDVNTGADFSLHAGQKANLETARALPRALRLRGLGGQIVIDFAPSPKKDRKIIEQALRKAFREDAIDTALVGWTPLGHFELQRKRERLPLADVL